MMRPTFTAEIDSYRIQASDEEHRVEVHYGTLPILAFEHHNALGAAREIHAMVTNIFHAGVRHGEANGKREAAVQIAQGKSTTEIIEEANA